MCGCEYERGYVRTRAQVSVTVRVCVSALTVCEGRVCACARTQWCHCGVPICGGVCDYGMSVCVCTTVVCMCVSASDGAHVVGVWVCVCVRAQECVLHASRESPGPGLSLGGEADIRGRLGKE